MEERRIGSRNVEPIRWVHVSWAIIKIDDRILMCSREDRERLDVPFYVLQRKDESRRHEESLTRLIIPLVWKR